MQENPIAPREVTMHEIPSIECMQRSRSDPIRSNFADASPFPPIEIPLNFIFYGASHSHLQARSPPSLPTSFVRVLARHVIVPYLAADGRADLRGRRYLLPFHFSFEKKSDVVLSQFRCKHMVSCLLFRIDACSLKVPTS